MLPFQCEPGVLTILGLHECHPPQEQVVGREDTRGFHLIHHPLDVTPGGVEQFPKLPPSGGNQEHNPKKKGKQHLECVQGMTRLQWQLILLLW